MSLWRDGVFQREHARLKFPGLRVVLTRFNMATGDAWARDVRAPEQMAAWMAHRVPIFERTCLASMRAQSEAPDLWLIGFDEAHRESAAPALALITDLPWAKPVWQQSGESASAAFARAIGAEIGAHDYVMTVRLDNDDALGVEYLAYARMYAASALQRGAVDDFWLSFSLGAVWDGALRLWPYPSNPFLTRVEATSRLSAPDCGALGVRHNDVFAAGVPVFQATTTQMMWLRVVHGHNVTGSGSANLLEVANAAVELRRCFALDAATLSD